MFLGSHIKMLMSRPEFCHSGRTPAAVVLSVMAVVIRFCGKLLVLSVKYLVLWQM
jgi:hypothetical protein